KEVTRYSSTGKKTGPARRSGSDRRPKEELGVGPRQASRSGALFAAVLLPGGLTSPDMPLRLVAGQDLLDLAGQLLADSGQALRDVFVHRALADAENGGRLAHRRFGVDDVAGDVDHPFPDIVSHRLAPSPGVAKLYERGKAICTGPQGIRRSGPPAWSRSAGRRITAR